jgi:hypothetical protein
VVRTSEVNDAGTVVIVFPLASVVVTLTAVLVDWTATAVVRDVAAALVGEVTAAVWVGVTMTVLVDVGVAEVTSALVTGGVKVEVDVIVDCAGVSLRSGVSGAIRCLCQRQRTWSLVCYW